MTTYRSQNGWPAYKDTTHFVRTTAAGRGWWSANADVAVVLDYWCSWFDRTIERIVMPGEILDDWSHAFRLVRGSELDLSNHASATARDLNSTRHPRGKHHTFTQHEYDLMRAELARITDDAGRPVLRLGAFYSSASTVDDMHVEIHATAQQVRQAADKIRAAGRDQQEDDMKVTDLGVKIETQAQADAANANGGARKVGDVIAWDDYVRWGGPGDQRTYAALRSLAKQVTGLQGTLNTVAAAMKGMSANSAPEVKAAFDTGLAKLRDELASIDINVTTDGQ
jgi:hypothetical protein